MAATLPSGRVIFPQTEKVQKAKLPRVVAPELSATAGD